MKNKLLSIFFTLLVATSLVAQQQQDPLGYLRQQCPKLTDMYSNELKNCHAHYIFAVDVSLSMCQFEETVRPALEAFVKALPLGDRVTVIPFAHDANGNKFGYDVVLEERKQIADMVQVLSSLYPQGAEKKDRQYYDTDIFKAQQEIAKSLQMAKQYEVNIIVFISDLLHCPANNIDRQFSDVEMSDMHNLMSAAYHDNAEYMVFTLELPQKGNPVGYVFPQLRELYSDWGVKVEQQRIPANSEGLIRQWFDKQKDRIMFMKLQSIIIRENKANPMVVKTEIDIDGNVKAHVEWKPTTLYRRIAFDTIYIANSDFHFIPNEEYAKFDYAGELCQDFELGQIKHKDFGFHKMADTLHFDVKLPVDYQSEINTLLDGRPGPLANTSVYSERTIFTFIFPLWFTIALIVLFIMYIIGVFKAIGRNNQLCFKGNITLFDNLGNQLDDMCRMGKQSPNAVIRFGANGTGGTPSVPDAQWQFEIRKQKANPFLVFAKPKFVWKKTQGYCAKGRSQSGFLSYDSPTSITLQCGPSAANVTHSIRVQLTR